MFNCEDEDANPLHGLTRAEYWLGDWNGGCNSRSRESGAERYYKTGTEHVTVVRRLLMDGRKRDPDFGLDISYGGAYGYGTDDVQGDHPDHFVSGLEDRIKAKEAERASNSLEIEKIREKCAKDGAVIELVLM